MGSHVRVKLGRPKPARETPAPSMEAGDPGHHGTSVPSPVEEGYRDVAGSVTTPHPSLEARTALVMRQKIRSATSRTVPLMDACPILALLVPSVPATLMAAGSAVLVPLATVEMASSAKMLMSAKKSLMPASTTMESTGVRTQIPATTACPAHHVSLAPSPLAAVWNTPPPTNRCASPVTPAQMGRMTVTRMPSATTSATTATRCTAASVSLVTRAMASSVGRTRTWTAGPTRTWCAWPMQLTTAKG